MKAKNSPTAAQDNKMIDAGEMVSPVSNNGLKSNSFAHSAVVQIDSGGLQSTHSSIGLKILPGGF